jgi:hypothetical protein
MGIYTQIEELKQFAKMSSKELQLRRSRKLYDGKKLPILPLTILMTKKPVRKKETS